MGLDIQFFGFAKSDSEKNRIVLAFELRQRHIPSHSYSVSDFYSKSADHLGFSDGIFSPHLIRSNAIGIQTAGMRFGIENHGAVSKPSQLRRTRQARWTSADQRNAMSIRFARLEDLNLAVEHVVDGVALQPSDLNWLLSFRI